MNLKQLLEQGKQTLSAGKVEEATLESELLLRHVLKKDRVQLFLDIEKTVTREEKDSYLKLIGRRLEGEPTPYITGNREFYNLNFYVDMRVLIPRPESELLVEKTIDYSRNHSVSTIADIGTGSGAIAISLATNLPGTEIFATDISSSALEVASINCRKHKVEGRVKLVQGDLLAALAIPVDLILANLPYVEKSAISVMPSARYEPLLALDGGENGLDKILRFCHQVKGKLKPEGCLLLEIGQGQSESVITLLDELFPTAKKEFTADLAGIETVVALYLG